MLKVEATSDASPGATLTAYDNSDPATPVELGPLAYNSKRDKYAATFDWPSSPVEILVTSSEGGQDSFFLGGP
jgi:hypothetical protein